MANHEQYVDRPQESVHHDPDNLVENIFRVNGQEGDPNSPLDAVSHWNMEEHLRERLAPEAIDWAVENITVQRDELREAKDWRLRREGWILTPKRAVIATLLATVAINVLPWTGARLTEDVKSAAADISEEASIVWWKIQERFFPLPDKTVVEKVPGEPKTTQIEQHVSTTSEQDKVNVNPADISQFLDKVEEEDASMKTLVISGGASDELGVLSDDALTRADKYNEDLAMRRADAGRDELVKQMRERGMEVPETVIEAHETIMSETEKARLIVLAKKAGYNNASEAIRASAEGREFTGELGEMIAKLENERGFILTADVESVSPGEIKEVARDVPQYRPKPVDEKHDYKWPFLLPIPPLPRFRRRIKHIRKTVQSKVERIREMTWMRVYPEGIERQRDNQGVEQYYMREYPWQYTRKFQYLLRDDRIKQVLRAEYRDTDGEKQDFRVMFVDHEPTTDTVAMMQAMLEDASQVQGGSIAEKCTAITVFPSDNAGPEHGDPKRVALGIDTQSEANTLGFNMPVLGLVEMHMPTNPTDGQLLAFGGAGHTFAHEILGHGSDIIHERIILDPLSDTAVDENRIPRRFATRNPWVNRAAQTTDALTSLQADTAPEGLHFVDGEGNVIGGHQADELSRASDVRLDDGKPTRYSDVSSAEAYAEAVMLATSGTEVPFSEAAIDAVGGYTIGENLQSVVQEELDASNDSVVGNLDFGVDPEVLFYQGEVKDDPVLSSLSERAKKRPVPAPEDMAEILTSISR